MVVVLLTVSIEGLLCTREVCSRVKELSGQRGCPCSFTISCSRQTPTLLMDKLLKFAVSAVLFLFGIVSILLLTVSIHEMREPPQYMVSIITSVSWFKCTIIYFVFSLSRSLFFVWKLICILHNVSWLMESLPDFGKWYKDKLCCFCGHKKPKNIYIFTETLSFKHTNMLCIE